MAAPSKQSKAAIENLRSRVETAQAAALADPLRLATLDELRARAEGHKLGTVASGWINPYPKADPRALLLEYQFADFHDRSRFKIKCQARQTGKDFTGEGEVVED